MKKFIYIASLFFLGCSTTSSIKHIDEKGIALDSVHWNEYTSQKIVVDMASQMLSSSKFSTDKFYAFGHIRNDTLDHPDTKMLAENIVHLLKKNGNLNFIEYDPNNPKYTIDGYCNGSLYGDMQHNSDRRIMDFQLTITCTNTQTDLKIGSWKTQKRNHLEKGW